MTENPPRDSELLRMMIAGDDQAFASLYRRHQQAIFRFVLLMSGSASIAEEVTQEVFLVLIRSPQHYDSARGSLSTYLYGVSRNHVLRLLKRERNFVPLLLESEGMVVDDLIAQNDPLADYTRGEVIKLVRTAVLTLPARYREVVVLCDFQELSIADTAAALDCPIGTVNSRLHRAHALLLKKLRATGKVDSAALETQTLRCFA